MKKSESLKQIVKSLKENKNLDIVYAEKIRNMLIDLNIQHFYDCEGITFDEYLLFEFLVGKKEMYPLYILSQEEIQCDNIKNISIKRQGIHYEIRGECETHRFLIDVNMNPNDTMLTYNSFPRQTQAEKEKMKNFYKEIEQIDQNKKKQYGENCIEYFSIDDFKKLEEKYGLTLLKGEIKDQDVPNDYRFELILKDSFWTYTMIFYPEGHPRYTYQTETPVHITNQLEKWVEKLETMIKEKILTFSTNNVYEIIKQKDNNLKF